MKFDYRDLSTRIWQFNENKALGLSAVSVYFYLLKIGCERAYGKFSVSDSQISRELKITRKTVKISKEKLRHFGIISYQTRSGVPAEVQLHLDYPLTLNETLHNGKNEMASEGPKMEVLYQKINVPMGILPENMIKKTIKLSEAENDIPTLEEFIKHAKLNDSYEDRLLPQIKNKYDSWKNNGWKNNFDRPITNWKSALKNTMPYLKQ